MKRKYYESILILVILINVGRHNLWSLKPIIVVTLVWLAWLSLSIWVVIDVRGRCILCANILRRRLRLGNGWSNAEGSILIEIGGILICVIIVVVVVRKPIVVSLHILPTINDDLLACFIRD